MGDMSKLDAVNYMLLMAGESLVNDLDDNSGLDTETAEFVLNQYTKDFQMRGIANNKCIKKITLTTKGTITLPANTISAELVSHHTNADSYNIIGIAKGTGTNIYLRNVTDQSSNWDANTEYRYELILNLPWEDMDTPVQRGILSAAARQYQMITQGDADADQYLSNLEGFYTAKAKGADLDDRRRSVFTASSSKLRAALSRNEMYNDATRLRYWKTTGG